MLNKKVNIKYNEAWETDLYHYLFPGRRPVEVLRLLVLSVLLTTMLKRSDENILILATNQSKIFYL